MNKFPRFESPVVFLEIDHIDTDQIIPARFLKTVSKEGLGERLFCDWRYDAGGKPLPEFALNKPHARAARVLLAGDNFGCGSSREHAVWALVQFGFCAVISTSFADIFRRNALKNHLLPIQIPPEIHRRLAAALRLDPGARVTVDLTERTLQLPDGTKAEIPIDDFDRHCLLEGIDELGYVLGRKAAIAAYEAKIGRPTPASPPPI